MTTTSGVLSSLYTPLLNSNLYHLLNIGVNTVSNYNTFWHGFYYSNASPSNYGALGMWGQPLGSASFNAMGNERFGVCTTTPAATLDINGTTNISEMLTSTTHINSGNLQSLYIQSATLSNTGNLSVGGTLYPTALSMSTNPLYIRNGNAGITYTNVSGTGQTMDGPAIYGWQGGVLGYVGNGSNFAPGTNGINGTLCWNYSNVGIRNSNPQYPLHANGTAVATMFTGNLAWDYLTFTPALLSNSSVIGWSNIAGLPAYVGASNMSLSVYSLQTPSNILRIYTSSISVGYPSDTNSGVHVWANGVDGASFSSNGGGSSNQGGLASWWGLSFRCLSDNTKRHLFDCRTGDTKFKGALTNTGDAFFSSNVLVGLGITANLLTVNNMFVNNTISALAGISSGGDIISSSAGGNNIGTSGSPWGGLNTLTASLGDATTTSLSNSGVISMNSGDGDKIVLTFVGANASKISYSVGWNVNYCSGFNNSTCGVHNFYTADNGSWSDNLQISS
jgi:hypothetical protein